MCGWTQSRGRLYEPDSEQGRPGGSFFVANGYLFGVAPFALVSPFKRQYTVDLFCPLKSEKVKIWTISSKKDK